MKLIDLHPQEGNLLKEVLAGLSHRQKNIHPKYLYDQRGSEIFDLISTLPEYYPTRTEMRILTENKKEIAHVLGEDALIIEPGSGSSQKIRVLLSELKKPKGYVPLDISKQMLLQTSTDLARDYSELDITPICADFTLEIDPKYIPVARNKIVFFPGSTIGNFSPGEALLLLKKFRDLMSGAGGLLIGVDRKKDKVTLEEAYDDAQGVTREFNMNLLQRLNNEVNADFNLQNFSHEALYNEREGRVEMHLRSKTSHLVRINQTIFRFLEGESIHTESSYKYTEDEFSELCLKAKLTLHKSWTDRDNLFVVYYLKK